MPAKDERHSFTLTLSVVNGYGSGIQQMNRCDSLREMFAECDGHSTVRVKLAVGCSEPSEAITLTVDTLSIGLI